MRLIFESFLIWLAGFFPIALFIAGRAFFFHAAASHASQRAIDIFIEDLHPFLKHLYASYFRQKFSSSIIFNTISLFTTSILSFLVIIIFGRNLLEYSDFLSMANNLFWISLSLIVLVRLWLFGYKIREIQASLDKKAT
jgi:hypothetical protein